MKISHRKISAHADIPADGPKKPVKAAIDTGLDYWYFTRHGLGPGMMPKGVQIVDWYEEGYKTWIKLDKLLTTEELNYYDIQEEWPPAGAITHNGEEIQACSQIEGATVEEMQKAMEAYTSKADEVGKQLDDLQTDALKKAGSKKPSFFSKFGKKKVNSAMRVKKVAELDDSIEYVVGADEDEDFLDQPEQEYSSADTAINGKQGKLPAVFSKAIIPDGALVLDYGGGTPESEAVAQSYLDQFGATEMLYDPYNQSADHNRSVISELKKNGGADVAVCSNVLNVIKEPEVRLDVLQKIARLLKPGATAYISVYEGNGSGEGGATQNGKSYQNKRKLGTYLEEIQSVFPDAVRKGAVIVAPNNSNVNASTSVKGGTNINAIDLNLLKQQVEEGCYEYLTGPQGGFKYPGEPREDKWDMFADEVCFVDVNKDAEKIVVEIRADLSYEGMINMSQFVDPVVQKYDPDAYFDMEEPGIMSAYLFDNSAINGATDITAVVEDDYYRDVEEVGPNYWEYGKDESDYELSTTFSFEVEVTVDEEGQWDLTDGDPLYHADIYSREGVTESQMNIDFLDLIEWHIPADPGVYKLKGKAKMVYMPGLPDGNYYIELSESAITDLETIRVGNIESSTDIKAAMTEEDLDYAILNDKPFDLESFKKYKTPVDPDAILAGNVQVGDIIEISTNEQVNEGTVVRVLAINDPAESWIDLAFKCEVVSDPGGMQGVSEGSILTLYYMPDEEVGYAVID